MLLLGLPAAAPGAGTDEVESTEGSKPSSRGVSDDDLRIRGIFNSELPGTERKNSLRLIIHPHFGDILQRDYQRTPIGLRYGLTHNWEVTGTVETYFSHGLGDVPFFDEAGVSKLHFGTKYRVGERLFDDWDLAVGLNWERPIGSPPSDITDGLQHVNPYISLSHPLSGMPNTRIFGTFGYDDVTWMRIPGELEKNELGDDALEFSAGLLHQRGAITYTFEAITATTRFTGRVDRESFGLRPGLVWVIPERYTFGAKGRWLLGASVRAGYGPDGMDFGGGIKLRINFDLKRMLGRNDHPPP